MRTPVSVRFLLNMYTTHVCRVSGKGVCSVLFSVLNGVKEGEVISHVLFCVSMTTKFSVNWLKQELAATSGIFSLALLHMARVNRRMLDICDHYALEYSILFNARKSKCISFGPCYGY